MDKATISAVMAEMGRKSKGVKKCLTEDERKRRSDRLAEARKARWPKKDS